MVPKRCVKTWFNRKIFGDENPKQRNPLPNKRWNIALGMYLRRHITQAKRLIIMILLQRNGFIPFILFLSFNSRLLRRRAAIPLCTLERCMEHTACSTKIASDNACVVQWIERPSTEQRVRGSNPVEPQSDSKIEASVVCDRASSSVSRCRLVQLKRLRPADRT